jgi:hypothetical protein
MPLPLEIAPPTTTDGAVGEQDRATDTDLGGELLVGNRQPGGAAARLAAGEHDVVSRLQGDRRVADLAQPQLGPGEVLQDGDRPLALPLRRPDARDRLAALFRRAVGEIDARDPHARVDQTRQNVS